MSTNVLEKLHQVQLEMLDEFDGLCKKHGLSYWLDSGSALGAVRHKGFIPWDDDVDIGMMREDYDKFVAIAKKELPSNYVVQDHLTDPYFKDFHIKIIKLNTHFPQRFTSQYKYQGIQIDVFPFDYVPDTSKRTLRKCQRLQKFRYLYFIVEREVMSHNIVKRLVQRILKMVPSSLYRNYFECSCRKYNGTNAQYVTSHTYRMQRDKVRFFKAEDLVPTKRIKFEDREYGIMNNPDAYLKNMYGDYMTLPPEEKRECHLFGEIIFDTNIEIEENQK